MGDDVSGIDAVFGQGPGQGHGNGGGQLLAHAHEQVVAAGRVMADTRAVLVEEGLEFTAECPAAGGSDHRGVLVLHGGGGRPPEIMHQHQFDPFAGMGQGGIKGFLRLAGQQDQGLAVAQQRAVVC